ncbi:MAG TPA: RNA-binding S4 domain-containing protein [Firmicutes bacterium]|uniref:RNA-binding S4 domain-containing protein n=1 Tax=Capillibacterium thermochitinicola TaxID=2699427 RepID=A0A8J6I2F4_9FIRM|nr:RNA-binding S4 domain-containing protein [Capillibacterium thermochitinicola]MBA2133214.1 RNA-binding S4 domain-containing protein [Capillibacterium thermochitinicola]HHW12210.1 RNA-binding S4 domain-containing protein [Bacillota bacterium]
MEAIVVQGESIRLEQFLKFAGAVMTGGEAKQLIQSGMVKVNGETERRRGRQLRDQDVVTLPDGSQLLVRIKEEESAPKKD